MAVLVGCAPQVPPPPAAYDRPHRELTPVFPGAPTLPAPDLTDDGPGSLVEVTPVEDMSEFADADATAVKIKYRSTSGVDGAPSEVSGVVVVPPGVPPKGGWPIVSFGHSVLGVNNKCAPTLAEGLGGYASSMGLFLARGWIVALSDYDGLGVEGYTHSVVDGATLGNNVIDAARAARRVLPSSSTSWAAFGIGEGGLAAWAAAERAGIYDAGMNLVGSVAIAPYADLSDLVDAPAGGTFSGPEKYRLQVQVLQSFANMDPLFDLDAYRSSFARAQWDLLTDCVDPEKAQRVLSQLGPDDLRPRDAAAAADLRRRLSDVALPAKYPTPGSAPVLVTFASDDPHVPSAGVRRALAAACAKGESVEVMTQIGENQGSNDLAIQAGLAWLQARFQDQRLANVCVGAT
jgi:hypothetical protein